MRVWGFGAGITASGGLVERGEGLRMSCRKRWEDLWPKPGSVPGSSRWEEGMGG